MQQLALAVQLQLAQDDHANGLGATEVERTNSSKVPWLVVGPDGIELAIAHKVRVAPPTSLSDQDTSKAPLVRHASIHVCAAPPMWLPICLTVSTCYCHISKVLAHSWPLLRLF